MSSSDLYPLSRSYDPQMLLDPLEEQFDLPARLVQGADSHRGWAEDIGQEHQYLARFGIFEADAPQVQRVALLAVESGQRHSLVADDAVLAIAQGE